MSDPSARLELLRSRQKATGEQVTRIEPEIGVVMLEMLVNNFFGGSVSYEELRDRFVPALLGLIDHMVSDTVAHRLQASFGIRDAIVSGFDLSVLEEPPDEEVAG